MAKSGLHEVVVVGVRWTQAEVAAWVWETNGRAHQSRKRGWPVGYRESGAEIPIEPKWVESAGAIPREGREWGALHACGALAPGG